MTLRNKHFPIQICSDSVEQATAVTKLPCLTCFAPEATAFLTALSGELLHDKAYKPYPELLALGFWLRTSNLKRLEQNYLASVTPSKTLFAKPLGTVLHISPGNVDTMFVYSWVCSLLAGNNNIVRTSSQVTEAQRQLLAGIAKLFANPQFSGIAQRNVIAFWPKESDVSAKLSQQVQARMIWGGDDTVASIRKLPTLTGCRDIAFADKFSVSVLKLNGVEEQELQLLAERLWRDMNTFQQAACSSPKVLVFCDSSEEQKMRLYAGISALAAQNVCEPATCMNHLVAKQLLLSQHPTNQVITSDALSIVRIQSLNKNTIEWHPAQNFLYEYPVSDLGGVFAQLPEHCQTVSHFGFTLQELQESLTKHTASSVDRVVPVGQALNFSEYWDGYDVLKQLSRVIELVV